MHHRLTLLGSHTGRPSIDPELMMRMLIIGYVLAIRSERQLCAEVQVNLAYRWFCRITSIGRRSICLFRVITGIREATLRPTQTGECRPRTPPPGNT